MKILITGASGFIGGFLVEEALNRGHQVWAGVRAGSSRNRLNDNRINFIDIKYADKIALTDQLRQFADEHGAWDCVIHNAGLTKTPHPSDFFRVNTAYTASLIEALAVCKPKKFVLISTLGTYAPGDPHSLRPLDLDSPQIPTSLYGKSKLAAERILVEQTHFPYVVIYPTGVYGPYDQDYFAEVKSINAGLDFSAGLTPQHISFIYVKDLALAVLMAAENPVASNKRYFISDGIDYTDANFAACIKSILKKKRLIRIKMPLPLLRFACIISGLIGKIQGKAMTLNADKYHILKGRNWLCDSSPIQRDLNFRPRYNLQTGLEETIAWYKTNGWL
jgi:nucleoside-diphosphate-sugar epimerase